MQKQLVQLLVWPKLRTQSIVPTCGMGNTVNGCQQYASFKLAQTGQVLSHAHII